MVAAESFSVDLGGNHYRIDTKNMSTHVREDIRDWLEEQDIPYRVRPWAKRGDSDKAFYFDAGVKLDFHNIDHAMWFKFRWL